MVQSPANISKILQKINSIQLTNENYLVNRRWTQINADKNKRISNKLHTPANTHIKSIPPFFPICVYLRPSAVNNKNYIYSCNFSVIYYNNIYNYLNSIKILFIENRLVQLGDLGDYFIIDNKNCINRLID